MALDSDRLIVTSGTPGSGEQLMVSSTVSPNDVITNATNIATNVSAIALNTAKTTNQTHTGDASGSSALTLATVNSNVGSFTNADVTVNAKGLITAVSNGSGGGGGGDAETSDPLSQFAATTSLQFKGVISDETGSGPVVFATSPTLVTPALGTPASGVATNLTGTAASLTAGNVTTNANLTGGVTSVGNAATVITNANLTGGVTSVGNAATVVTNANLTGDVTSSGNSTTIATDAVDISMLSATGTASGTTFLRGDNTWSTPAGGATTIKLFSFPFDNGASAIATGNGLPIMLLGTHTLTDLQWISKTGDIGSIVVELKEATVTGGTQQSFTVTDTLTQLAGDDTVIESGISITLIGGKVFHANILSNADSITGGVLVAYGTLD